MMGIIKGSKLTHYASTAENSMLLLNDLFDYLKKKRTR